MSFQTSANASSGPASYAAIAIFCCGIQVGGGTPHGGAQGSDGAVQGMKGQIAVVVDGKTNETSGTLARKEIEQKRNRLEGSVGVLKAA